MSADKDNLLDPTNPKSPYNRHNYNSPYSYANPLSSHYNQSDAAIAFLATISIVVVLALIVGSKVFFLVAPPFWSGFVFFSLIPFMGVVLYFAGNMEGYRWGKWFAGVWFFCVVTFAVSFEIISRMEDGTSGMVNLFTIAFTGKAP